MNKTCVERTCIHNTNKRYFLTLKKGKKSKMDDLEEMLFSICNKVIFFVWFIIIQNMHNTVECTVSFTNSCFK